MDTCTDSPLERWRGSFLDLHSVGTHDALGLKFRQADVRQPDVYVCKLQRARRAAPRGPPESWRVVEPGVDAEFHVTGRVVRQACTVRSPPPPELQGGSTRPSSPACTTLSIGVAPREDPASQVQWARIPAAVHDILLKLCPVFPVDVHTFLMSQDHAAAAAGPELALEASQLHTGLEVSIFAGLSSDAALTSAGLQAWPGFPLCGAGSDELAINEHNVEMLNGLPVRAVFKLTCRPKPYPSFQVWSFHGELTRLEITSL